MELFVEIFNERKPFKLFLEKLEIFFFLFKLQKAKCERLKLSIIFTKSSILDVLQGSKYASE